MNLDHLRTYLKLVKLGSFSAVAKELSISQPAVSFQIQKLEHDLGARLINRGQKKITMTEVGKRLLRFARTVDDETSHFFSDLDRLRQEVSGELVIAASTIPSEFLLPSILGEFMSLHPAIRARVTTRDSLTIISGVRDGTYQIGFCGMAPPKHQGLESLKVAQDEIVLIVFPEHPFAKREQVSFAELEEEPLIFREATSGTQKSLETLLSEAGLGLTRLTPHLVLGNTQVIVSSVEARAGIAFVSNLAIKKSLELGLVQQLAVDGLKLRRDFYCIYYKGRVVSRLLQEFLAFIQMKTSINGKARE
ncbi:MAG: LysR family transcriptional regulator [Dehalococcoidales bacterium]